MRFENLRRRLRPLGRSALGAMLLTVLLAGGAGLAAARFATGPPRNASPQVSSSSGSTRAARAGELVSWSAARDGSRPVEAVMAVAVERSAASAVAVERSAASASRDAAARFGGRVEASRPDGTIGRWVVAVLLSGVVVLWFTLFVIVVRVRRSLRSPGEPPAAH